MKNIITINYIPNILSKEGRKSVQLPYVEGCSIKEYCVSAGYPISDIKAIVGLKAYRDLGVIPNLGDNIIIAPDIGFDPLTWTAIWYAFVGWMIVAAVATSIYAAVTYKTPSTPNYGTNSSGGMDESSPTYGWDGIQTTQDVGRPIPIVYGEHAVGGEIINAYVSTDGEKNYLNLLLALCEGEIDSVSGIKINDNPVENFSEIEITEKLGTNDQDVIPNFEDLHDEHNINSKLLKDTPYSYTTVNLDCEGFDIYLTLPSGLFYASSDGSVNNWDVVYRVEYKLHSSGTWIDLGLTTISYKSRSTLRRIFEKRGLTPGQYDIRVTRTSEDSDLTGHTGDLYLYSVDEIRTDDLAYPNTALEGIKALAQEQLSGGTPNFTFIVKGKKVLQPKVMNGAIEVDWKNYYYDSITSEWKLLSDGTVLSWDGTTYVTKWCANPAWCVRDLLLNTRYGLGEHVLSENILISNYLEMAKYFDERVPDGNGSYEKRMRMDVVIDSASKAPDLLGQLCSAFRGMIFYSEGILRLKVDKPEDPVQIFGMGNICDAGLSQQWKSKKDIYNVIDAQFLDKDKNYEQEQISYIDEDALAAGDPIRRKSIRIFCTRVSQAIREARYALNVSKRVVRSIGLKVGPDALVLNAGDVFGLSHDVPQIGYSGRVKTGSTTTSIVLDRSVTLIAGLTYKMRIRFADDTMEERAVTSGAGTYTTITTAAFSKVPAAYDVYVVGQVNILIKKFRAMGLQKDPDNNVILQAIEYDELIYDDTAITLPNTNYSELLPDIQNVQNLQISEHLVKARDGTIEDAIDIWFEKVYNPNYIRSISKVRIYMSTNNTDWIYKGETLDNYFLIMGGIVDGETYYFKVVTVTPDGEEGNLSASPGGSITIVGKSAAPSNVTGFDTYQEGNFLKFSWNAIPDADLARYVIKKGSEWNTGQTIAELIDTTEFMYPVGETGDVTFMIKAVDTSGNESAAPGVDTITIIPPPEMNFINTFDLWSQNHEYKLSNLALVKRNDYDVDYVRNVFALMTQNTWESRELEGKTWEQQETDLGLVLDGPVEASGYYEMVSAIDLSTIFEFKIFTDVDYLNLSGGSLTIQISISEDGITYSSFADISANMTYRARYIKFKFIIATTDANHNVYFYGCVIYINAPSVRMAWGKDVLIPVGGKTILFGAGFSFTPRIAAVITNGIKGVISVDNKTVDQMDVKVYDLAGSAIGTAEIDWEAKGF